MRCKFEDGYYKTEDDKFCNTHNVMRCKFEDRYYTTEDKFKNIHDSNEK